MDNQKLSVSAPSKLETNYQISFHISQLYTIYILNLWLFDIPMKITFYYKNITKTVIFRPLNIRCAYLSLCVFVLI